VSATVRTSLAVVAVATVAAVAGYQSSRRTPPLQPRLATADAPARLLALELPDLDGKPQSLRQWRGKILVVNFWASWCAPCREELPEFAELSRRFSAKEIQFVGIGIDSAGNVRNLHQQMDIPYPTLIGSLQLTSLIDELGNKPQGLPFTVILGSDGRARLLKLGRLPAKELEAALLSALAAGS
jgi:thiol-disulfide isomerase/thioredoxin